MVKRNSGRGRNTGKEDKGKKGNTELKENCGVVSSPSPVGGFKAELSIATAVLCFLRSCMVGFCRKTGNILRKSKETLIVLC